MHAGCNIGDWRQVAKADDIKKARPIWKRKRLGQSLRPHEKEYLDSVPSVTRAVCTEPSPPSALSFIKHLPHQTLTVQLNLELEHRVKRRAQHRARDAAEISKDPSMKTLKMSDTELDKIFDTITTTSRDGLGNISLEQWARGWKEAISEVEKAGGNTTVGGIRRLVYVYNTCVDNKEVCTKIPVPV